MTHKSSFILIINLLIKTRILISIIIMILLPSTMNRGQPRPIEHLLLNVLNLPYNSITLISQLLTLIRTIIIIVTHILFHLQWTILLLILFTFLFINLDYLFSYASYLHNEPIQYIFLQFY